MRVKSDLVEFMRTLVTGDFDANDRYEKRLDKEGWDGWPEFLGALFFLAVHRRFGGRYDQAKTIQFVADLRAGTDDPHLDPAAAEQLIKSVFVSTVQPSLSPEEMGNVETLAVYKILSEESLTGQQLDAILGEARRIAERQLDSGESG